MTWRVLIAVLLLQVAPAPRAPQQTITGSIEGIVLREGDNEPLDGVRVSLLDKNRTSSSTSTMNGKFEFRNLSSGTYRLAFAGNGYVRQEFGQRVLGSMGTPIELAPGQEIRGLVVHLTLTGSVSGRIQDTSDNPLPHIPVALMRPGFDESGKKILRPFGTAYTNDLGEYRIYFVTPGQYYVLAGTIPGIQAEINYSGAGDAIRESFTPQFFPGSADARHANLVEVQAGGDKRGIDLTLQKQPQLRIRGRIVDSASGQSLERVTLRLVSQDIATGDGSWGNGPGQFNRQNGAFEFHNISPGKYLLSAFVEEPDQQQRKDRVRVYRIGSTPVEVADSSIDGVVVTLNVTASIPGRVIGHDGQPGSLGVWNISINGFPPQGMQLHPAGDGPHPVMQPQASWLESDGTFRIFNLTPGDYLFSIDWLSDEYIKEARFAGIDLLKYPLRFTGSESGPLEIVISPNMGAIEGKVLNNRLEPVPAAQVALVPDQSRDKAKLFRGVVTDATGRFNIPRIVPGDYKLFAWEAIEPYGYFDPELLQRSESKSLQIHVGELSKQTVSLTAIPAR